METHSIALSNQEKINMIRLARTENVGAVTFQKLISLYGTAEKALEYIPEMAKKGGAKRSFKIVPPEKAIQELDSGHKLGAVLLCCGALNYPYLLSNLEAPPPLLWALGNTELMQKRSCGVVGARNASAGGHRMASGIAQRLSRSAYITVSGLARGIDTVVHHNSLSTGTIAVLAGGLDQIYPPENSELYHKIASGLGVIVSEMPFGCEPQARLFPRRNRIISGLSLGVVVIEASLKSGSLITAKYALEQNREVFAVPGSPLDPRCEGSNMLIRQGATLIQTSYHVIEGLDGLITDFKEPKTSYIAHNTLSDDDYHSMTDKHRQKLKSLLSHTPTEMDTLVQMMELTTPQVLSLLLELELAGYLERHRGGAVSLVA